MVERITNLGWSIWHSELKISISVPILNFAPKIIDEHYTHIACAFLSPFPVLPLNLSWL